MTQHSLSGRVVALSMSPPNDLRRLGYPVREFEQLVFALTLRIVHAGGRISHGGHLQAGSLLVDIVDHLASAYGTARPEAGAKKPLLHLLAQSELVSTKFARLAQTLEQMRAFAETRVPLVGGGWLDLFGRRDPAGASTAMLKAKRDSGPIQNVRNQQELEAVAASLPKATVPQALQRMREAQAQLAAARIAVGGRRGDQGVASGRDVYGGAMPGIYEEAFLAIDAGQPVLFLAAYGGAARDAAADLGLIPESERVPMLGPAQQGVEEARRQMQARRARLAQDQIPALGSFAVQDDSDTLAREVVKWIAERDAGKRS